MSFPDFSKQLIALAPMDGYTDCAFREVANLYGNFDLTFTEFVNVQGFVRATKNLVEMFRYTENQRPIIAQLFGTDPEYFYEATVLLCHLGFDGIDINMGCPARTVASKGGGAGLIRNPELAVEIIDAVKRGVKEHQEIDKQKTEEIRGYQLSAISSQFSIIKEKIDEWRIVVDPNRDISVSVKTRTGYDEHITEEWIKLLSDTGVDFITLHGRTLKQMYTGNADWNEISKAVKLSKVPVIGNGDVNTFEDIQNLFKQTGCSGVMIGRGALGKYWRFKGADQQETNIVTVKKMILEHAKYYVKFKGEDRFYELRKHLFHYIRDFEGARVLRGRLVQVNSLKELKEILNSI